MSRTELAQVMPWRERVPCNGTASRGHIASSRPMLTKGCCKGNNYEQCFALDTFPADFSWRNVLAKPCILLFTWQQDCNTREACRLLLVVKVVFVVFPNSAGRIGNSTNPITRFSGRTRSKREGERFRPPREGSRAPGEPPRRRRSGR